MGEMTIREATLDDLPELLAGTRNFMAEAGLLELIGYHEPTLSELFRHVITAGSGLVLVAEAADGTLVGGVGALVHPHLFNATLNICSELFWFIYPEYRQGRLAWKLLRMLQEWATGKAGLMALSAMGTSPESVTRLYELLGFTRYEAAFARRL